MQQRQQARHPPADLNSPRTSSSLGKGDLTTSALVVPSVRAPTHDGAGGGGGHNQPDGLPGAQAVVPTITEPTTTLAYAVLNGGSSARAAVEGWLCTLADRNDGRDFSCTPTRRRRRPKVAVAPDGVEPLPNHPSRVPSRRQSLSSPWSSSPSSPTSSARRRSSAPSTYPPGAATPVARIPLASSRASWSSPSAQSQAASPNVKRKRNASASEHAVIEHHHRQQQQQQQGRKSPRHGEAESAARRLSPEFLGASSQAPPGIAPRPASYPVYRRLSGSFHPPTAAYGCTQFAADGGTALHSRSCDTMAAYHVPETMRQLYDRQQQMQRDHSPQQSLYSHPHYEPFPQTHPYHHQQLQHHQQQYQPQQHHQQLPVAHRFGGGPVAQQGPSTTPFLKKSEPMNRTASTEPHDGRGLSSTLAQEFDGSREDDWDDLLKVLRTRPFVREQPGMSPLALHRAHAQQPPMAGLPDTGDQVIDEEAEVLLRHALAQ